MRTRPELQEVSGAKVSKPAASHDRKEGKHSSEDWCFDVVVTALADQSTNRLHGLRGSAALSPSRRYSVLGRVLELQDSDQWTSPPSFFFVAVSRARLYSQKQRRFDGRSPGSFTGSASASEKIKQTGKKRKTSFRALAAKQIQRRALLTSGLMISVHHVRFHLLFLSASEASECHSCWTITEAVWTLSDPREQHFTTSPLHQKITVSDCVPHKHIYGLNLPIAEISDFKAFIRASMIYKYSALMTAQITVTSESIFI